MVRAIRTATCRQMLFLVRKEASARDRSGRQSSRGRRQALLCAPNDVPWLFLLHSMCVNCTQLTLQNLRFSSSAVNLFLVSPALACQGLRQAAAYIPTPRPVNLSLVIHDQQLSIANLRCPAKSSIRENPLENIKKTQKTLNHRRAASDSSLPSSRTFSRLPPTRFVSFTLRPPSDKDIVCLPVRSCGLYTSCYPHYISLSQAGS
jgi:hypothetical protein